MASRNRGKPKPKLRDLSQQPLTFDERDALIDGLAAAQAPIVLAILGAVMVEHELEYALRGRLGRQDDKIWFEMLDERGPFSTFSRKITAGYALRLYDDATRTNLDVVRQIRNAFAHSKRLIDFGHPLVVAQLKRVAVPSYQKKWFRQIQRTTDPLSSYRVLCVRTTSWLLTKRLRSIKAKNRRLDSKPSPIGELFKTLAPAQPNQGLLAGLGPRLSKSKAE